MVGEGDELSSFTHTHTHCSQVFIGQICRSFCDDETVLATYMHRENIMQIAAVLDINEKSSVRNLQQQRRRRQFCVKHYGTYYTYP